MRSRADTCQSLSGPMRLHRLEREQMVRLPVGELGDGLGMPVVRRDLARIFDYRQAAVARLLG